MRSTIVALAFGALAAAADIPDYKSALDMTLPNPNVVDVGLRASWCKGERNTCNSLCDGDWDDNDCEEDTLKYKCTCTSNSSAPGLQFYTQTMPYYICTQLQTDCITKYAGNADMQDKCNSNIGDKCATKNPPSLKNTDDDGDDEDSSSTSTQSAPTKTKGSGNEATNTAMTTTKKDNFAAPTMGPGGTGAAAAAAIGVFAYLL